MQAFSNVTELKKEIMKNTDLQEQFRADPVQAARSIQVKSPLDYDVWIYRIVVLALGITVMAIIFGVIALISSGKITDDKGVPTILTAIGSAAIGALAGLLAPSPKGIKG